jgi:hypothetical protein
VGSSQIRDSATRDGRRMPAWPKRSSSGRRST